jgi:adenylate cyclase
MVAVGSCPACGLGLRDGARFCDGCGAPVIASPGQAEYKQVTVLFADVVRSMQIAAAVGPERLREIIAEVVHRCTAVVRRYGGTVDKFTGDGIMALFGAPVALEDHALRACLAALDIHTETRHLADELARRDDITMQLRVGLNSGQVIAGEIGSGAVGYTAIGEQVGLAQRMESAAPPGGVMLSESTARLVEHATELGEPELVDVKGADEAVRARLLLAATTERAPARRREPTLVGRTWELTTLAGILDQAIGGAGCVAGVVGPPGIGKSRLVAEAVTLATGRGIDVISTFCESHAREIPFHAVVRLLRAATGISDLDRAGARARVRTRTPDADPDDLLLLDDLLGIGDPDVALPDIAPDARRRRLAALLNAAALARVTPAVYVVEDAHWIDEASEAMLAEFLAVVPQTASLVLITYRPEYDGALSRTPSLQRIALAPLTAAQTAALTTELLGSDPSVAGVATAIGDRAAGNPFFVGEMVRDLAERGVLVGGRGAYRCGEDAADIAVPGSLQATIAARIDRLGAPAKQALYAGAVIGARFATDLLTAVLGDTTGCGAALAELLAVELIDQVRFTPRAEYAFRHPLIRTVAYESQLKSSRTQLHRRLAAEIEARDSGSADADAALIAEHLQAAGDLRAAHGWHMRAGIWSTDRDLAAARTNWQRARRVADRLPVDAPDRTAMQIAPRSLLCGTAWRSGGSVADLRFDELRDLCTAADDKESLATGMAGFVMMLASRKRFREAGALASELHDLLESIGEPTLTVGLLFAAIYAKLVAGDGTESLRLAQRAIDLADGDPTRGNLIWGSPLSMAISIRGNGRMCLGIPGWHDDVDAAIAIAAPLDPMSHVMALMWKYIVAIPIGALPADATALGETADNLRIAEQCGDNYSLCLARLTRGLVLAGRDGPHRDEGLALITQARDAALAERFTMITLAVANPELAKERVRTGDLDGALDMMRAVVDDEYESGESVYCGLATTVLVESLLQRGTDGDLREAQAATDRLAAVPTHSGYLPHELPLLRMRALLARARGEENAYRTFMASHHATAAAAGFEGLVASEDATGTAVS